MSCITTGTIYFDKPVSDRELEAVHEVLAETAEELHRSRGGTHWQYQRSPIFILIWVQDVDEWLFDCEEDLEALGLLPEDGMTRIFMNAGPCGEEQWDEVDRLLNGIAGAIGGHMAGPQRLH